MENTEAISKNKPNVILWVLLALLLVLAIIVSLINFGIIKLKADKHDSEAYLPAIKVIISNGCGFENLAADYSHYISDQNIDVIRISDMPKPIYDKSMIVMQKEDAQDLARLQKMTGIQLNTTAIKEDADAQFIIILGRDIANFKKDKGGRFGR